jgi:hypothetical protein
MASLAGLSLLTPSAGLDWLWGFKHEEYLQMRRLGPAVGAGFLVLALLLALAAWGCLQRKRWGWAVGFAIIAINALGDAARLLMGGIVEGLTGLIVAGAILWWLGRPAVRAAFR